jgi:hypothetical protein
VFIMPGSMRSLFTSRPADSRDSCESRLSGCAREGIDQEDHPAK